MLTETQFEKLGAEYFSAHQLTDTNVPTLVKCFRKISPIHSVLVVGCGPHPQAMLDFESFGIEGPCADTAPRGEFKRTIS